MVEEDKPNILYNICYIQFSADKLFSSTNIKTNFELKHSQTLYSIICMKEQNTTEEMLKAVIQDTCSVNYANA